MFASQPPGNKLEQVNQLSHFSACLELLRSLEKKIFSCINPSSIEGDRLNIHTDEQKLI